MKRIKDIAHHLQQEIVAEVLDIIPGTEFVSRDVQSGRLVMCESCESMNKETRKCKECGCFIDQKIRVLSLPILGAEHCPQNRW